MYTDSLEASIMSDHGTCGNCEFFGDGIPAQQLVQIRVNPEASAEVVAGCKAPSNAAIHLRVGPTSGCDSWKPAA